MRRLILLYFVCLVIFIISSIVYRVFFWDLLNDQEKIDLQWFVTSFLIGVVICLKIIDLLKEHWDDEAKRMDQHTIQELRKDIAGLYTRLDALQYPAEPEPSEAIEEI